MFNAHPPQTEYVVYAYNNGHDGALQQNRWTMLMRGIDERDITLQAESLFQSKQYKKIEIQKKYFDPKKNRPEAVTYKVYQLRKHEDYLTMASIALLAFSSVGFFYLQF